MDLLPATGRLSNFCMVLRFPTIAGSPVGPP